MSRPENENPNDRLEKTARELRKHRPRPSEALISRIERLAERGVARRAHSARIQVSRRKLVFALAAALAISVVGAVVAGELHQSSGTTVHSVGALKLLDTKSSLSGAVRAPGTVTSSQDQTLITNGTAVGSADPYAEGTPSQADASSLKKASISPVTTGKRLAELRAVLTLKVKDKADLSKQTAKAMRIARSLGGYVATADYQVPSRGVAISYLKLKLPAARSQDALSRISVLGEILSQNVSLEDIQRNVTVQTDQIQTLSNRIGELQRALDDPSLTSGARSQLQVQLANARANLHSLQAQRKENVRKGRLATITLTLTTGDLPKLPAEPSRIHKAIDRAWNGLSSEISWAATGLIVASPFLLLAAVAALLIRARRRREERRLLEK